MNSYYTRTPVGRISAAIYVLFLAIVLVFRTISYCKRLKHLFERRNSYKFSMKTY